jgi:hypothetical protein
MHYGREFLSMPAMWDSEKAQHLRSTCARVSTPFLIFPGSMLMMDLDPGIVGYGTRGCMNARGH